MMAIANPPLPPAFTNRITLTCSAAVGGERLFVQTQIVEAVYNEPNARKAVEESLRRTMMEKILERWTPVIKVERADSR